jgi:hypothetical protein
MVAMVDSSAALLSEIEAAVLDEDVPITVALRKCLVLGGRANSEALRDWASKELNGYSHADELPEYRVLRCALVVDGFAGALHLTAKRISPLHLPEKAREHISEKVQIFDGISKVQDMADQAKAKDGHVNLSPQGGAELAVIMSRERTTGLSRVEDVYWQVSSVELHGIVDRVRTICTALVAELRGSQRNNQADPKPKEVQQAVTVVLSGKARMGNVITNQAANASQATIEPSGKKEDESQFWTRAKKIGAFVVGIATILGTVAGFLALHH